MKHAVYRVKLFTKSVWHIWESEDWLEVKCGADVELDLTIDQGEVVMSIYTLMDCKWLAGIMTKWKQSASYPWALFSIWVLKEQLFWTNKAYLTKCGVHCSPIFSFLKWGLAVLPFDSIVIEWELHHYLNELVLYLYWKTSKKPGMFELTPLRKQLCILQSSSLVESG